MGHIFQNGTSVFKVGNNVFRVKDNYSYVSTPYAGFSGALFVVFDPVVSNNRFFVSCYYSQSVQVVNATTFAVIATVSNSSGVGGISFDSVNNRLFVCGSNNINIYDGSSFVLLNTINSIATPQYVLFDPVSAHNRFFVADYNTNSVYILDGTSFAILSQISGFTSPVGIVVDVANNRFFVANEHGSSIYVYDATSLAQINDIGSGFTYPYGMAIDPVTANNRIIVADLVQNLLFSINLGTLGVTQMSLGFGQCRGVAFDPNPLNNRFLVTDFANNSIVSITQSSS
jgi:hypothetical protein